MGFGVRNAPNDPSGTRRAVASSVTPSASYSARASLRPMKSHPRAHETRHVIALLSFSRSPARYACVRASPRSHALPPTATATLVCERARSQRRGWKHEDPAFEHWSIRPKILQLRTGEVRRARSHRRERRAESLWVLRQRWYQSLGLPWYGSHRSDWK